MSNEVTSEHDYLANEYDDIIARLRSIESRSKGKLLTEAANAIEELRLSRNNWRDVASRSAAELNAAEKEIKTLRRLREMGRGNGKVVTYAADFKIPRVQYDAISPERRDEVIKQCLREKVVSLMVDRIYYDRAFNRKTSYDAAANTINVRDQINVIMPEVEDE